MEATIFVVLLLLGIVSDNNALTVRDRMDYLEMQVNRESFKSKTDIIELRQLIAEMNSTDRVSSGGAVTDQSWVNTNLKELEDKLETFIQEQSERTMALSRAVTDEKLLMRNMIKIIREVVDSNEASVLDTQMAIEAMEDRIVKIVHDENEKNLSKVVQEKIDDLNSRIADLQATVDAVQQNAIIQKVKEPPCPYGWLHWNDVCYLYVTSEKLSWYGATIRCNDYGGSMAEPDSESAMRHMLGLVGSNVWIGGTDEDNENTWMWVSSQRNIEFLFWEPGQPNSYNGNQDCMEVFNSLLNDETCTQENNYVCQKKANA